MKKDPELFINTTNLLLDLNCEPTDIVFNADDFKVEKRKATVIYNEPLFIQQYHTLIFNIDGKEYRFERV